MADGEAARAARERRPVGGGRGRAAAAADRIAVAPWVDRLSIAVLALMMLYTLIGIPSFSRAPSTDTSTDAVNPLNRFVWLGLLLMAMPVALARFRAMAALVRASWPILLLYGYFAASTLWALDPATSARRVLFSFLQLLLAIMLLTGLRRAATLHVLIASVCAVAAFADLLTWAAMPGFAMTSEGLAGLQTQKNQTGLLMMYGCLSAGPALFLFRGRLMRALCAGAVLMMLGLLVATRSTTSQSIVLMAPVVVPLLLCVVRLPGAAIWSIGLSVPAAVAVAALGWLGWCGLGGADPWGPMRGVTFTSRTDLWSFVLGEIGKRPWFGAGFASFWAIDPAVQPSLKTDMWFGTYAIINEAHEGYLDLLATGGVVGFAGGLFVVLRTLCIAFCAAARAEPAAAAWPSGRLARPTAAFHLALLLGLLVHNFTESNLFSNNSVLAVAFILAALDLEAWRLSTRRPVQARFPRPTPAPTAAGGRAVPQAAPP